MARTQSINDGDLIGRLSGVFRREGYAGASLAALASASGLKKASLYHRFPGGKEQMADEVLGAALEWYKVNVLEPLKGPGTPRERAEAAAQRLDAFYDGGRQSCLLNVMAAAREEASLFHDAIKGAFSVLTEAFAALAIEAGATPDAAKVRAERALMMLHGSLVMSRAMGSSAPFRAFSRAFADDLTGEAR